MAVNKPMAAAPKLLKCSHNFICTIHSCRMADCEPRLDYFCESVSSILVYRPGFNEGGQCCTGNMT